MTIDWNVLVTGGAGYIGSHCCKLLAQLGMHPVVFDNLDRGHADAVKWGPLVVGDIRDTNLFRETLKSHRIDAVIHFAALAYVGESVHEPQRYYENNLGGMISVLAAMRAAEVERLVFSSSCATYGIPSQMPILENVSQVPINPYGRTKLACEWMLQDAAQAYGLKYAALRYFNAAGADPEGELGERHEPETHLIPLTLLAAYGRGEPLRVFGTDYPTPDGTCVRDYIHVSDLAQAHFLALRAMDDADMGFACNLGTGTGVSVREIIASVERVTGREVPVIEGARRAGDPPVLVADPRSAQKQLGFGAQFRSIDDIVSHAAPWFMADP